MKFLSIRDALVCLKSLRGVFFFVLAALGTLSCGSDGELGETCDTRGSTEQCAVDLVCTRDEKLTGNETPVCLKQCDDQSQCAADEDCNGVSNTSTKSCQKKSLD